MNMHRFNSLFEEDSGLDRLKGVLQSQSIISHLSRPNRYSSLIDPQSSPSQAPNMASPPLSTEAPAEWSAVGHAAATGKSGRVIHNLQEEVARLKRDSALWQSRAEESQRNNEALKIQLQNMADHLRTMEQLNETNTRSIERKERKIEALRAELHTERTKRHDAQIVANETNEAMRVERQNHHRELARMQEEAKYYENRYEVLSNATRREKADLGHRVDELWARLRAMSEAQASQSVCAERLMVIGDQKDREIDGLHEKFERVLALFAEYKKEKDKEFRDTVDQARGQNSLIDAALAQLKETEEKMKWVIRMSEINESKQGKEAKEEPTAKPPSS